MGCDQDVALGWVREKIRGFGGDAGGYGGGVERRGRVFR